MIALYRGISPISRAIRFFTWSDYSHASYVRDDRSLEIESWHKGGVRERSVLGEGHPPCTKIDLFRINASSDQVRLIEGFLRSQVGKGYDYRGVVHFISRRDEELRGQERWFCSELVFAAHAHAGIHLLARVPAWKVSPGLLSMSPLLDYIGSRWTTAAPVTWPKSSQTEGVSQ